MSGEIPISVIILTYNEEANIEHALKSVYEWASEIIVVDSYSTDRTLEIARKYTDKIYQHPFENFAQQRNWAVKLPINNDWVFYLDSDEMVTDELKKELELIFSRNIAEDITVFAVRTSFFFLGNRLRFAHQAALELRVVRKDKVFWEFRGDEWLRPEGRPEILRSRIIHRDRRGLEAWINKQNKWSSANARYLYQSDGRWDTTRFIQRKVAKYRFWQKIPLFIRPFLYFTYRY